MSVLDRAERRLGRFAIPHLTLYIVVLQAMCLVALLARTGPRLSSDQLLQSLVLIPDLVKQGQWWRLFTFVAVPASLSPIWEALGLYFFYIMGSALEGYWGEFRYNLFLLTGYLATVGAAWIYPGVAATTGFLAGSIFLAFAWLYPEFVIYIFFIIPVRIKWLALITWVGIIYILLFGEPAARVLIGASLGNFFLFFLQPIFYRMRYGNRHMVEQAQGLAARGRAFHTCAVCGITDKTHPKMDFRYCPDCVGSPGYCEAHIHDHVHRTAESKK